MSPKAVISILFFSSASVVERDLVAAFTTSPIYQAQGEKCTIEQQSLSSKCWTSKGLLYIRNVVVHNYADGPTTSMFFRKQQT